MPTRILSSVFAISVLVVGAVGHELWVKAQDPGPPHVFLGGVVFMPDTLIKTGTSSLIVAAATTPAVPSVGVNEARELHTLPELNIGSISLDYKESKRTDQYGNRFRFRAKVEDTRDSNVGR
jgi:hypothetical protein